MDSNKLYSLSRDQVYDEILAGNLTLDEFIDWQQDREDQSRGDGYDSAYLDDYL